MRRPQVRPRRGDECRRAAFRHFSIETLEPRQLLAGIIVNSTADVDDPTGNTLTLRQAIEISNGSLAISSLSMMQQSLIRGTLSSPNTIVFNDSGTVPFTISLSTPLPAITAPLVIDATQASGYIPDVTSAPTLNEDETDVEVPVIRIDGSQIDPTAYPKANGLTIDSVNCAVAGMIITDFSGAGIDLEPGPSYNLGAIGSTIEGNFIGVTSFDSTSNSAVADPTSPLANGEGIVVQSSNNRIGGTLPVDRNVIQGNRGDGVLLQNKPGANDLGTGNRVEGNYILDNGNSGVRIDSSNNYIGEAIGAGPAGAGNIISGNGAYGILIDALPDDTNPLQNNPAQGNVIVNNEIGTNYGIAGVTPPVRGMGLRSNALDGILILDSSGNTVGGLIANSKNVIAGNGRDGVSIQNSLAINPASPSGQPYSPSTNPNVLTQNADDNSVLGNWIGFNTRSSTTADLPNRDGVNISSANNTVGGTDPAARNIIIENSRNGVTISGMYVDINNADISLVPQALPTGNVVEGNYIGTQAGADYFRNTLDGVLIDNASGNTIGGTASGATNVISGNNNGVTINGADSSGNLVQGNLIGTMSDGVTVMGNAIAGVWVHNAPGNTIGGTNAGAANVISGNNDGVILDGPSTSGDLVQGNFIGTDLKGTTPIRNAIDGVLIDNSASNNTIGGTSPTAGNTIADNTGAGVDVLSGTGNAILSNSMFSNHRIGIDLAGPNDLPGGVTLNDSDGHVGPNDYQDFPTLATAVVNGNTISVQGKLQSTPSTTFTIQFFSSLQQHPSTYGEGQSLLGSTIVTTDPSGLAMIAVNFSTTLPVGVFVTATATDPKGNTSEFSQATPTTSPTSGQGSTTFIVTNNLDAGPGSLRQAIMDVNAPSSNPGRDTIEFAIPQTTGQPPVVQRITLFSPLPAITNPVIIDGYTEPGASPNPSAMTDVDEANLMVQIDGLVAGVGATGLSIEASNCNVSGLIITGFSGPGIAITGDASHGNWVYGNFIGAQCDPTTGRSFPVGPGNGGTSQPGILVTSSNNRIGGNEPGLRNVIDGNGIGVEISGTSGTGNLLQNNFILDNAQQGVLVSSSNNTIGEALQGGGNTISGNGQQGVEITGGPTAQGNLVVGNLIGTDLGFVGGTVPAGVNPLPNHAQGVLIENSPNNFIGGLDAGAKNVIAANLLDGILIDGSQSTGNTVLNNWIGFNIANSLESLNISNQFDGIHITSSGNTIGGTSAAAQNTVDNNGTNGIELTGPGASGNVIEGNVVGLNPGSGSDFGNTLDGIYIDGAPNNVIGGTSAGARNVISGNNNGVVIVNAGATGNVLEGNFIGTASDGVTQVGNAVDGVMIANAPRNVVGGAGSGAGNVISGNNQGVVITGSGSLGDVLEGNFIGTDLAAQVNIGNKIDGVLITSGASNAAIGGTAAGAGNTIAYNVGDGVLVGSGVGNSILSNSIFSNHGLGIDLGGDGVTPNHPNNSGSGPNNLQNYPVISVATPGTSSTNVQGTINAAPSTTYTLQFFSSPVADPSGHGQGQTLLGSTMVTTDASGNAPFLAQFPVAIASGQFISATATDPNGNTSEFSTDMPSVPVIVQFGSSTFSVNENAGTATVTIVRDDAGKAGQVMVNFATSDGTAKAPVNYTATAGTIYFAPGQTSVNVTIPIHDPTLLASNVALNLALSSPADGATLGSPSKATLTINKINLPGQLQFSTASYAISASAGTATITVTRTGGLGLPVSVAYGVGGGTALPGLQYTPVTGTLNFGPADTSKTFTVPVLNDGQGGSATVNLGLGSPGGGATLGSTSSATLTILPVLSAPNGGNGPAPGGGGTPSGDGTGPVVLAVQPVAGAYGITAIAFKFSAALDPVRAQYLGNYGYFILSAGRDGVFGTNDDTATAIRAVTYDPSTLTATVTPATPLPLNTLYRIVLDSNASASLNTGITDVSGNLLSGNGSGIPGGAYLAQFSVVATGHPGKGVVTRPVRTTPVHVHPAPKPRSTTHGSAAVKLRPTSFHKGRIA